MRARAGMWISWVALVLCAGDAPAFVSAQSWCESCEVQIGWLAPITSGHDEQCSVALTVNRSDSRDELGFSRVMTQEGLYDSHSQYGRLMADPYWGISLSRRTLARYERTGVAIVLGGDMFALSSRSLPAINDRASQCAA
jgi:hypothetical protein